MGYINERTSSLSSLTTVQFQFPTLLLILFSINLSMSNVNGQLDYFKNKLSSWNPNNYFGKTTVGSDQFNNQQLHFQPPPPQLHFQSPPPQLPFFVSSMSIRNNDSVGLIKPCKVEPTQGQLFNVTVTPCEGEGYCTLERGTNSTLEFEFVSVLSTQGLFGKLSGIFGWFTVPFGSAEDLCTYRDIQCPIQPWIKYKVQKIIHVSRDFPGIELDTKLQVYGDGKGDIGCALIPVKIK